MSFSKKIIEEQVDNIKKYGVVIKRNDCEFRFSNISENKTNVENLLSGLSEDISPTHYGDIIRDFIVGEAYEKLSENNIA